MQGGIGKTMMHDFDVLFSRFEVALGDLRAPLESKALHASLVVDPEDVHEVEMVDGSIASTTTSAIKKQPATKKRASADAKIDSFFKKARVQPT